MGWLKCTAKKIDETTVRICHLKTEVETMDRLPNIQGQKFASNNG